MSGYQSGSNYYNEIFADPKDVDRVYAIEPILQVTDDGGKTFHRVGERNKHVDNHSVWIDPDDTDHLIVGCDGGVYETLRRRQDVSLRREPADHAVLSRRDGRVEAVLQSIRRRAGQLLGRWSVRTRNTQRNHERRLVHHAGGDGFGSVVDPSTPTRVRGVAVRQRCRGSISRPAT